MTTKKKPSEAAAANADAANENAELENEGQEPENEAAGDGEEMVTVSKAYLEKMEASMERMEDNIGLLHESNVALQDKVAEYEEKGGVGQPANVTIVDRPKLDLSKKQGVKLVGIELEKAKKKLCGLKKYKGRLINVGQSFMEVFKDGQRRRVADLSKPTLEALTPKHITAVFKRKGSLYASTCDSQKLTDEPGAEY